MVVDWNDTSNCVGKPISSMTLKQSMHIEEKTFGSRVREEWRNKYYESM